MDLLIIILLLYSYSSSVCDASTLKFTSSPVEFHADLTESLILRCDVNNTVTSSSNLIGRRDVQSAADVAFLTSLVVMRNGVDHVASVTEHTPPAALVDHDILSVTGDVTGSSGSLVLTWHYPTDAQVAEYVCEANGVTSQGHGVVLTGSVEVSRAAPVMSDLIHYIHSQQVRVTQQQEEISELRSNMADLRMTLEAELKDVRQEVTNSRHVESGVIDCGPSTSWLGQEPDTMVPGVTDEFVSKTQSFNTTYDIPPVVHLGVQHIYDTLRSNQYYTIELMSVDVGGFVMRCRTEGTRIYRLTVSWLSVPR